MASTLHARLPLARPIVDRDYRGRDDENLPADPASRFLVLSGGRALLASPKTLALVELDAVPEGALLVYLGRIDSPFFVAIVPEQGDGDWGDLRSLAPHLSERDTALFVEALAIANWHASHPFSPLTGEATKAAKGGWVLVDPSTGSEHFPRTDNAIIVAVTDAEDRILLGSNISWESNRFSLLAGFVEPGESLEAAVVREVFEESGIWVHNPVYLGSQPWPFPASLMIGFTATVDPNRESTLLPDGEEISALRWFSRDELVASLSEIRLPGRTSIARAIIEDWFGGPIEDGRS